MKAIETPFRGYRMRSRLEARWAVFFDSLEIPWEYEAQGFHTEHGGYLPDFLLWGSIFAEVKPAGEIVDRDRLRMMSFARASSLLLLYGAPAVQWYPILLPPGPAVDWIDFAFSSQKKRPWYHAERRDERPLIEELSYLDGPFLEAVLRARSARFEDRD